MSASGQRRGKRIDEQCIPGDAQAWPPTNSTRPYFLIEVGGSGKRLRSAFDELRRDGLPPGWRAMVVLVIRRRSWWYLSPAARFQSLTDALQASAIA
jgi:hypothetical protein